jgi:pSer/pThr/pTyr-binding forkhead associated (FHA) protein
MTFHASRRLMGIVLVTLFVLATRPSVPLAAQDDDASRPAEFIANYLLIDETNTAIDPFATQNLDLYFTVVNAANQALPAPDVNEAILRLDAAEFPAVIEIPDDIPLYMALVLDTSGSMRSAADEMREAVTALIDVLPADANVTMIAFNDRANPHPSFPVGTFTRDRAALRQAVPSLLSDAIFRQDGGTCLYDATVQAINSVQAPPGIPADTPTRRAVVVFTDGEDRINRNETTPCSTNTESDALNASNNTPIYTVGFSGLGGANIETLSTLASGTGGLSAFADTDATRITAGEFNALFTQISNALNGQRRARVAACVPSGRYTLELRAEVNGDDTQTAFGNIDLDTSCVVPTALTLRIGTFRYDGAFLTYQIQRAGNVEPYADGLTYVVRIQDENGEEVADSPYPITPSLLPVDAITPLELERARLPIGELRFSVEAFDASNTLIASAENEFTVVPEPSATPSFTPPPTPTLTPTEVVTIDISQFRIEGTEFAFNIRWIGGGNLTRYQIQITDQNNVLIGGARGSFSLDITAREMRQAIPFADLPCDTIRVVVDAFEGDKLLVSGVSDDTIVPCTATPTPTGTLPPTRTFTPTPTITPSYTPSPTPTATPTPQLALLIEGFRIEGDDFVFEINVADGDLATVKDFRVRLTYPDGLQIPGARGDFPQPAEIDGGTTVRLPINELQCVPIIINVLPRDAQGNRLLREEVSSREAPITCTPTPAPLRAQIRDLRYSADAAFIEFEVEVTGAGVENLQQVQVVVNNDSNMRVAGTSEIAAEPERDGTTTIRLPVSSLPPGDLNICARTIVDARVVDQICSPFNLAHTATPTPLPTSTFTPTATATPTATPTPVLALTVDPPRLVEAASQTYGFVIVRTAGGDLPASYRITITQGGGQIGGQAGRFTVAANANGVDTPVRFSLQDATLGAAGDLEIQIVALNEADDPLIGLPNPLARIPFNPNLPTATPPPTPTPTPTVGVALADTGAVSYTAGEWIIPDDGGAPRYTGGTFTIDAVIANAERVSNTTVRVVLNTPDGERLIGRYQRPGSPPQPLVFTDQELGAPLRESGEYSVVIELELSDGTRVEPITRQFNITIPPAPVVAAPTIIDQIVSFIQRDPPVAALIALLILLVIVLVIVVLSRLLRRRPAAKYDEVQIGQPLGSTPIPDNDMTMAGSIALEQQDEVRALLTLVEPPDPNARLEIYGSLGEITLGRGDPKGGEWKFTLPNPSRNAQISRDHAYLRFRDGKFFLVANQEDNPTYLDDVMLITGIPQGLEITSYTHAYRIELGTQRQVKLKFEYQGVPTFVPSTAEYNPNLGGTPTDEAIDAPNIPHTPPRDAEYRYNPANPGAPVYSPAAALVPPTPTGESLGAARTLPDYIQATLRILMPDDHPTPDLDVNLDSVTIGRGKDCQVRFDAAKVTNDVSREHARLQWNAADERFELTHLSKNNPTLLNDAEITAPNEYRPLAANETHNIWLGSNPPRVKMEFTYRDLRAAFADEATSVQMRSAFGDEPTTLQPQMNWQGRDDSTDIPSDAPKHDDFTPEPISSPKPPAQRGFVPPAAPRVPNIRQTDESALAVTPPTTPLPPTGAPMPPVPPAASVPPAGAPFQIPPTDYSTSRALPTNVDADLRVISMPGGEQGQVIPFSGVDVRIGRDPLNTYVVPGVAVFISKKHCALVWDGIAGKFVFRDIESSAGTQVIKRQAGSEIAEFVGRGQETLLEPNTDYVLYLSPTKEIGKQLPAVKFSFRYTLRGETPPLPTLTPPIS